jgi:transcriptional regulator with XRE-family HTH domain
MGTNQRRLSAAQVELAAFLADRGIQQRDLAKRLGVRCASVSHWVCGRARPNALQREVLRRLAGIQPHAWLTAREATRAEQIIAQWQEVTARREAV